MAAFVRSVSALLARPAPMLVWIFMGILSLAAMGRLASDPVEWTRQPLKVAESAAPAPPPEPVYAPKPGKTMTVAPNRFQGWNREDGDPKTFKVGKAAWTARSGPDGGTLIRVEAPGRRAKTFFYDTAFGATVAVGRLDMGRPGPQMIVQYFTGGMHCCAALVIISPDGKGNWREDRIGAWEASSIAGAEGLEDQDGDGSPDFEISDDRFYYVFEGYSGSYVPTRMVQVRSGKLVDISRRPAFRDHFERQMAEHRTICEQEHSNSACAAFVANAARLGRLEWGWKIMLASYDRENTLGVSYECDPRGRIRRCLEPGQVNYKSYPAALRAHLKKTGYL